MQTETFQCECCCEFVQREDSRLSDGVVLCKPCYDSGDDDGWDGEPTTRTEYWDNYDD